MATSLEDLLPRGTVILDGAMGTLLQASGRLAPGAMPEELNLAAPDVVVAAHRAYIEAGSQIVTTNSFGGSRIRMARSGLTDHIEEFNLAAAALAGRAAAGTDTLVAGDIGPLGEMVEPWGTVVFADAVASFREQVEALIQGGVDLFIIETMFDLEEVRAAIEAVRSISSLPILATMTFDQGGRTMMGIKPDTAAPALQAMGADAIGSNCGRGPSETEAAVRAMLDVSPGALFVAQPNAGVPRFEAGVTTFDATPADMARYALSYKAMGVRLIGGCCGSTPAHIRAVAQAARG